MKGYGVRVGFDAKLGVPVFALSVLLAACVGSGEPTIDQVRMPQPGEGAPGAFYMVITGGSEDDRVIGAESPGCGEMTIHESVEGDGGMMTMQPMDELPITAGAEVVLEPGGIHLMCLQPTDSVVAGGTVPLTVSFSKAGTIEVEAAIGER